jgi:hypothetical protein
MSTFTIDFAELCFLAEACMPPRKIVKTMFWQNLTRKYYNVMTTEERDRLFEYMWRNDAYREVLETEQDIKVFHARFNPHNQYQVDTNCDGEHNSHHTFLLDGKYYTNIGASINENYIIKITKL